MKAAASWTDRQLVEAVLRKDVGEVQRIVRQGEADVNCKSSDVCWRLRGQVVVSGKIFHIFPTGGLYSTGQQTTIPMLL